MRREAKMEHLHPVFREKVVSITKLFKDEQLPFRLFEGFRSPQRQQYWAHKERPYCHQSETMAFISPIRGRRGFCFVYRR